MLVAVAGVAALYLVNTQIRSYVLTELQKRFPELNVSIGPVRLDETKGITISDLAFFVPGEHGSAPRTLLHVKELFLECPVSIQTLYNKELSIKRAVLRHPIIRLSRVAEGRFPDCCPELRRLIPARDGSLRVMPIEIHDGIVLYDDATVPAFRAEPLKIAGITMTITPPHPVENDTDGGLAAPAWTFSGSAASERFRKLIFEGSFETEQRHWEFYANCRQLDWNADFLELARFFQTSALSEKHRHTLESFQGRFDFGVSAVADPSARLGCRFAVEGTLSQGSATLYDIDRTLSELHGRFRFTDDGVTVEKLSGLGESARLLFSYSQEGLLERRRAKLSAAIAGLEFDEELVRALHPFLTQKTIDLLAKFEYAGRTDLDAELAFQDGIWKPHVLTLDFSDLSFSFREFPYKVERVTGNLRVDATAELAFNLATKPGEPLKATIQGLYTNVFTHPAGQVRIVGENVPIDERLMAALPAKQRSVVASLKPAGSVNADLLIKKNAPGIPLGKIFEIGLNNISIEYAKFPYPLHKICGVLRLDDDVWTFTDVVGNNGSALVRCGGYLKPVTIHTEAHAEPGSELLIQINATELPLDEQLAKAIPDPHQRELLASFQIKGKANIAAEVRFLSGRPKIDLRFSAVPCSGLSLQPGKFPYRLDDVQGQIDYANGRISSSMLKAKNRKTEIHCGLECNFSSDGQWMLSLNPLTIDWLEADAELADALPTGLRGLRDNLKLDKPLNLRGFISFSKAVGEQPLVSVWDIGLFLHQNSVNFGFPMDNIFGDVRLTGYAIGEAFRLAGDLNIRSASLRGFPVTYLTGPFFFDGMALDRMGRKQLYIGQEAGKILPSPQPDISLPENFRRSPWFVGTQGAKPLRGSCFEGTVLSEGLVLFGNNISYSVKTNLAGADLARIARHFEPNTQNIAGTLSSHVNLFSSGKTLASLEGSGSIQLRDANIYEAPGMIRLLRELSIRETDPAAGTFSAADVEFRLIGPQMRLDQITFEGGAFLLKGNGELRLDTRRMNLLMGTRLGNKRWQIPGISDLLGGAGDQLVQLNVHGPIADPTVTRVLVPEAQKVLQSIQGEGEYSQPSSPQEKATGLFPRFSRPF